ncbi:MAG: insulinase family protein [Acidobacteriia bacterium]|nr:insulinase family protein [Terriglobia bacterium]
MTLPRKLLVAVIVSIISGIVLIHASDNSVVKPAPRAAPSRESNVTEWTMPNGLAVVHIRKPSSKVLASIITVNVGSKDENSETSGLSHLLEHMVFDGTQRRGRAEINEGSKRYGGYVNATTRAGFTCYLSIFPAEFAELSLDLQGDMLFHSTILTQELEKERRVVIEEMKKDRDSPVTRAAEFHDEQLFQGTAYARPVLGFEQTIASVPRSTVLTYYQQHYVPSRMKAMIISPFPAAEVKQWMDKTFGMADSSGAPLKGASRWTFPPAGGPHYKEEDVPAAYLHVSLAAPALGDTDYFAYDLLTRYLAEGGASPLQRALRMVRPPLADSVSADLETEDSFSTWKISMVTQPTQIPDALESLSRTLQTISATGIPAEEMTRLQRQVLSQEAILAEQAMYYGFLKAPFMNAEGYSFVAAYPERLRAVTAEAVRRVAEHYFSNPVFFTTALVPKGKTPPTEPAGDAHAWKKETLPNGVTLIAKGSDESDVFAMSLFTRQRSALEPQEQEGISDFVQRMLLKGTVSRSEETLQKELDNLSAQIQFVDNPFIPYDDAWTTNRFNFFRLEVLDELRGRALDLMGEVVANANFPDAQVAKVREEIVRLQTREADNSSKRAVQRLHELLLASTPYTRTILGSEASIRKVTRDSLIEHHKHMYTPSNLVVIAAGKGTTAGVLSDLRSGFEGLKGDVVSVSVTPPTPRTNFLSEKVTVNKQQTQIAAGTLATGWNSPDATTLRVLNAILSERLAVELREKQGLAYSVGSDLQQEREYGWLEVRMGTRAEAAEQAREGLLAVVRKLAGGEVSAEERERAINGLWGSLLRQRLSRIGQSFYRGIDEVRGSGFDAEDRLLAALKAVSLEDLKRVAGEALNTNHWVMVSVGKN